MTTQTRIELNAEEKENIAVDRVDAVKCIKSNQIIVCQSRRPICSQALPARNDFNDEERSHNEVQCTSWFLRELQFCLLKASWKAYMF